MASSLESDTTGTPRPTASATARDWPEKSGPSSIRAPESRAEARGSHGALLGGPGVQHLDLGGGAGRVAAQARGVAQ